MALLEGRTNVLKMKIFTYVQGNNKIKKTLH